MKFHIWHSIEICSYMQWPCSGGEGGGEQCGHSRSQSPGRSTMGSKMDISNEKKKWI
jgi:hypothetical protein